MVTTIIAIIAFETTGEVVNSKKKKMNIYKSRRKKARVRRAAAIFAKQLRSLAEEEVEDEEEDRLGCLWRHTGFWVKEELHKMSWEWWKNAKNCRKR